MAKRTATKKRWGDCTEEEDIDLEYPQWMLYMGVVPEGGIEDKALGSIGDNTSAAKQANVDSIKDGATSPHGVLSMPESTESSPPSSSPSSPRCRATAAKATAEDCLLRHTSVNMMGPSERGRRALSCSTSALPAGPTVDQWSVDIVPEGCWDEPWSPPPAHEEADAFFGAAPSSSSHRPKNNGAQRLITAAVRAATLPSKAKPSQHTHGRSDLRAPSGRHRQSKYICKEDRYASLLERIHVSCSEIFTPQTAEASLEDTSSVQDMALKEVSSESSCLEAAPKLCGSCTHSKHLAGSMAPCGFHQSSVNELVPELPQDTDTPMQPNSQPGQHGRSEDIKQADKHAALLQRIQASCREIFTVQPAIMTLNDNSSPQETAAKQQGIAAMSSHSCMESATMGQPSGSCAPTCSGHLPASRPADAAPQPRQQPLPVAPSKNDPTPHAQPAPGVRSADAPAADSGPLAALPPAAAPKPEHQARTKDDAREGFLLGSIPSWVQTSIASAVTAGYCAAGVAAAVVELGSRPFRWC